MSCRMSDKIIEKVWCLKNQLIMNCKKYMCTLCISISLSLYSYSHPNNLRKDKDFNKSKEILEAIIFNHFIIILMLIFLKTINEHDI